VALLTGHSAEKPKGGGGNKKKEELQKKICLQDVRKVMDTCKENRENQEKAGLEDINKYSESDVLKVQSQQSFVLML